MPKLIVMGECLIDFLPAKANNQYVMKAGGAPVNVCASVAILGQKAYYLGKLSNDYFGKFLLKNILKFKIKSDYISFCDKPTSLAFINLDESGDRSFSFCLIQML